ncbi:integrase [Paraburkholderia eburnea]|uniref:Integrase n=1 Tax=Paraburkholderia eburnea TaxID=1189126 RepID=A0A2S4MDL7_9BURK|nr:tyrosine-type recombinase/integrase [Paraburkholderia eburnea]POR52814.1 integrase [Paraburkholderia eburnea]PRZ23682.1 integrase [Paraburkholderia eburnea]
MAARRRNAERRNWPDNTYKNTQGTYWFRNPYTGKTYGLGTDQKVAFSQARAANAELERQHGDVSLVERMSQTEVTLVSWCKDYSELYEKRDVASGTLSNMKSALKTIAAAPFAKKMIQDIQPAEINLWVKSIAQTVSDGRAGRLRSWLHNVFNEAIAEGLLKAGANPVDAIRKPTHKVTRQRLTLDDFLAIVEQARKQPTTVWAARAFMLALLTGQRREDIRRMQFPHIKDGYLWVEQTKSQGNTKLKIPTSIGLRAVGLTIDDVIRECRDNIASKHVIHYAHTRGRKKAGRAPSADAVARMFTTCRQHAKIVIDEGKTPPTFHEIRSLAARLYGTQYGAEFAQALLGHKSGQMTALYRDARGREWKEVRIEAG